MEIKIARRNGTIIDSAAFIPAKIMVKEASTNSTFKVLFEFVMSGFKLHLLKRFFKVSK